MNKIITTTLVAGFAASSALAGASVTADFASAYVFRGTTFNDGFVIQPGVEADGLGLPEAYGTVAIGAWGNVDINDPYNEGKQTSQFSEIDWYGSYSLPSLVDGLDLFIGYTEYTYPNADDSPADKEVNVGIGYDLGGVALGASMYSMIGGALVGQNYFDLSAGYTIEASEALSLSLGALIGYVMQGKNIVAYNAGGADDGLNEYVLDAAVSYALGEIWSIGASVAYIGQLDDQVLVDRNDAVGDGNYDVDVVGMVSVGAFF